MPVNVDVVKQALNDFEGENFVDAKEKIAGQIKIAKNDYIKNKLGLSSDPVITPEETKETKEPEENKEPEETKEPKRRSLRKKN